MQMEASGCLLSPIIAFALLIIRSLQYWKVIQSLYNWQLFTSYNQCLKATISNKITTLGFTLKDMFFLLKNFLSLC